VPEAYRGEFTAHQAIESVVRSAGLIFGRNVFQRGHDESLRFVAQLKEILAKYPS
jgi:DhnA family fructose-bisphosphate aldolase class Ia